MILFTFSHSFNAKTIQCQGWDDFFEGKTINEEHNESSKFITLSGNAHVHNCIFSNMFYDGKGSCVNKDSGAEICLLIEWSSFTNCSSTNIGGAICFRYNGEAVLQFVCSVNCSTTKDGQLCFITVSNIETNKNFIIDSTITSTNTQGDYTLDHQRGKMVCYGTNVSNNKVSGISGLYIANPTVSSSVAYSSFRNNNSSTSCIRMNRFENKITDTNVIDNDQISDLRGYGIIQASSSDLTMIHCSIYGNTPGNKVFSSDYVTIKCYDCSVGVDQTGNVTHYKPPKEEFINYYAFVQLEGCIPAPESWGNITPVTPPPLWLVESLRRARDKTIYYKKGKGRYHKAYAEGVSLRKILPDNEGNFVSLDEKDMKNTILSSSASLIIFASLNPLVNK